MSYIYNLTDTWNDAATTFTSIKMNATDTASAAASLLMDLQVGGSSRFSVGKTGDLKLGVSPTGTNQAGTNVIIAGSQGTGTGAGGSIVFQVAPAGSSGTAQNALATALTINADKSSTFYNAITTLNTTAGSVLQNSPNTGYGYHMAKDYPLSWGSGAVLDGTVDVLLRRDAANTLALRNGANGQTQNIYGTYTDASNYRRVALAMTTAGVATLKPEGAGTGATGNVIHISGLPTSNPGPGILWNNAGTPAIGT